jgi:hypothetical protein
MRTMGRALARVWQRYGLDLVFVSIFVGLIIPGGVSFITAVFSDKFPIRELVRGKTLSDAAAAVLSYPVAVWTVLGTFNVSPAEALLYWFIVLCVSVSDPNDRWTAWRARRAEARAEIRRTVAAEGEGDPGCDLGKFTKPNSPAKETRPMRTIARGIRRLVIVVSIVLFGLGLLMDKMSGLGGKHTGGLTNTFTFFALVLVAIVWATYVAGCWVAAGFRSGG